MPKEVLYRKYRSQTFDELVGQKEIVQILKRAVAGNEVAHAYLFSGPRGVGKTSVARILARAVNCENVQNGYNPCNTCDTCSAFLSGSSLDLIEIDAASHRGIDDIRFLQEGVNFAPTMARKKVFIIDEVHMLTKEAFNALLKTLEEPPLHSMFILATTEINKVPETVLSRCQGFYFTRLHTEELVEHLKSVAEKEGKVLSDQAGRMIAENTAGGGRDSLTVLEQLLVRSDETIEVEMVASVLGMVDYKIVNEFCRLIFLDNAHNTLKYYYEQVYTKGVDAIRMMKTVERFIRVLLLNKYGIAESTWPDIDTTWVVGVDKNRLIAVLDEWSKLRKMQFEIDSLYIELLVITICAEGVAGQATNQQTEPIVRPVEKVQEPSIAVAKENIDVKKNDITEEVIETNKVSLADYSVISGGWDKFVIRLNEVSPILGSILKMASLMGEQDGYLVVKLAFPFHKMQLEQVKNKDVIGSTMKEVFGNGVPIRYQFASQDDKERNELLSNRRAELQQKAQEENRSVVSDVIEIFGGKEI